MSINNSKSFFRISLLCVLGGKISNVCTQYKIILQDIFTLCIRRHNFITLFYCYICDITVLQYQFNSTNLAFLLFYVQKFGGWGFFGIWKQVNWRAFSVPSEVKSNSMESERAIQQAICTPSWVSLQLNAAGINHTGSGANRNSRN